MRYVNAAEYGFVIEPRYYFYGWSSSAQIIGRESVLKALADARCRLPNGFNFKIWDLKRTRKTQILMRQSFRKRLQILHPELSRPELERLVSRFGAKLPVRATRLGTHLLGGAVDLTIVDHESNELYMGTDHDDLTARASLDYYETRSSLSLIDKEAMRNRQLLKDALMSAQFKSYSYEWWHWGFDN